MLRPLNDQIVVEPLKPAETSRGGLILPEASRTAFHGLRALVLATGPGNWTISGERLPLSVGEGDIVILRHAGPLLLHGDRVLSIVSERDILCITDDKLSTFRRYSPEEYGGLQGR